MARVLVFVYGTLKRGWPANQLLAGQEFVGPACTESRYRLFDQGSYPCLVEDRHSGLAVRGELWRVDEMVLPQLDAYEGIYLFRRDRIDIAGVSEPVWAYFYNRPVTGFPDCGPSWPRE